MVDSIMADSTTAGAQGKRSYHMAKIGSKGTRRGQFCSFVIACHGNYPGHHKNYFNPL
jgi:hypothetical protein